MDESGESTQQDDVTGIQEEQSHSQIDWDKGDGVRWGAASRDEVMRLVGWLEFNVPFQHKYGYIRDERR